MVQELEVQGATVQEAIQQGLKELKVRREDIDIKILDEGANGLFGLVGAKPARVFIRLKTTQISNRSIKAAPQSLIKKSQPIVEKMVKQLIEFMQLKNMSVTVAATDTGLAVDIDGPDKRLLIGKNGQTLEALHLLVSLMLNKGAEERVSVDLDVDGYQRNHSEQLIAQARETAEGVAKSGIPSTLEPMSSHDRLIIHTALKDHPSVETCSDGQGSFRHIVIRPKTT